MAKALSTHASFLVTRSTRFGAVVPLICTITEPPAVLHAFVLSSIPQYGFRNSL